VKDRNTGFRCAVVVAAMLTACTEPTPVRIDLAGLKEYQVDLDGQPVVVSGTLRTYEAPRHYWIENESLDRVALEGDEDLAPLVGKTLEVSGVFLYDPDQGRRIEVDQLRTLR